MACSNLPLFHNPAPQVYIRAITSAKKGRTVMPTALSNPFDPADYMPLP